MLRAGVAGVGNLGKIHLATLMQLPDRVAVTALADPIPERRAGKALQTQDFNIAMDDAPVSVDDVRAYADYSELVDDPDVDVVCIATPSDLHAPAAIRAMDNGKHVFTEKPMALSAADCERMLAAARANGRTLMVGHVLRFWPAYEEAGRIVASRRHGRTLAATLWRYGRFPSGWFAELGRSGGVKLDLHIHDVDTALWWWGEPEHAFSRTVGRPEAVSAVFSRWEYPDGAVVHLEALWDAGSAFTAGFRVVMEEATLAYDMIGGGELQLTTRDVTQPVAYPEQRGTPYFRELEYFLQSLTDGSPPARCSPEASAMTVRYAVR